jgi:hypothetical protein
MKNNRFFILMIILFGALIVYLFTEQKNEKLHNQTPLMDAHTIIKKLNLTEHPEGGYFKETYRSTGVISEKELGPSYSGDRKYSTCIYFLLTSEKFSAFHKINQDEIWHFYKGTPLLLHIITKEGVYKTITIGNDFEKGEVPQYVVKGGDWFAAEVIEKEAYALVGCTVAPGFDFADFVLPERKELVALFPQHQEIISKLTHH